jgi:hypothetical protein
MPEDKSALDQALDLLFFAPVGLLLTARQELPSLVEKGRQRVTGQAAVAKVIGKFAVAHGQKEVERTTGRLVKQAVDAVSHFGADPSGSAAAEDQAATGSSLSSSGIIQSPRTTAAGSTRPAVDPGPTDSDRPSNRGAADDPSSPSSSNGRSGVIADATAPSDVTAGTASDPTAGVEETQSVPDPATLAIPGYDVLSASQVVQRLAGLAPSELDAVGRYEAATRGRRTILSKVAQLQIEN